MPTKKPLNDKWTKKSLLLARGYLLGSMAADERLKAMTLWQRIKHLLAWRPM